MSLRFQQKGWFSMVEVEISTACNRKCSYCPNSVPYLRQSQQLMHDYVFDKLLSELSRIDFIGRMSYHLYNEPLLHPYFPEIVNTVTQKLPKVRQVLYTNGDFLTDDLYPKLKNSGIARFIVTSHDNRHIKKQRNQVVLFPEMLHLTNRGGAVLQEDTNNFKRPLSLPCYAPSSMLIVTNTGDVILCYEDAKRITNFGNICDNSLEDIWFSDNFINIRKSLINGDRSVEEVCCQCNNTSHPTIETFDYRL